IAEAAASAAKVVSNTAVEKAKTDGFSAMEDHNTLIRIETKLQQVISDVSDLKTNIVARVDRVEQDYVTRVEHGKVIDDIVALKNWRNWILGGMGVMVLL